MKKSKVFALTLVLGLLFVTIAGFAQKPDNRSATPEERAQRQTERMTQDLKLNDKQAAAVKEINLRYAQKMAATKNNSGGSTHTDNFNARKEIFEQKDKELQAVLTPEQFSQFKAKQTEKMNRMEDRMQNRDQNSLSAEERAQKQVERMQKSLNLSPEQQQKAGQIALKYAKQADALRSQSKKDRETTAGKFATLRDQREQEMRNLLTEEQKIRFDELKKQHGNHPPHQHNKGNQPRGGNRAR